MCHLMRHDFLSRSIDLNFVFPPYYLKHCAHHTFQIFCKCQKQQSLLFIEVDKQYFTFTILVNDVFELLLAFRCVGYNDSYVTI